MKSGNGTGGFGQPDKGGKKAEMVSKGRLTSANNMITKLQERGKALKAGAKKHEKQLIRTAHHAGQHATTISTAASLSYMEGYYGRDKMNPGGVNVRRWVGGATLIGGLVAEGMGYDTAGGYAQAVGAGAVLSDVCSSAQSAGIQRRSENQAKAQGASATPPGDPKSELLNKLETTPPADPPGKTEGVRRAPPQQQRRAKHRVEPDRRAPTVPPHLAHLLRESRAA